MSASADGMGFVLSNVRLDGHRDAMDVRVEDGVIRSIDRHSAADPGVPKIDGKGELLIPGLVDSHCHVDKTLWGDAWVPHSAGPLNRPGTSRHPYAS